jgi:hypothetical protein
VTRVLVVRGLLAVWHGPVVVSVFLVRALHVMNAPGPVQVRSATRILTTAR